MFPRNVVMCSYGPIEKRSRTVKVRRTDRRVFLPVLLAIPAWQAFQPFRVPRNRERNIPGVPVVYWVTVERQPVRWMIAIGRTTPSYVVTRFRRVASHNRSALRAWNAKYRVRVDSVAALADGYAHSVIGPISFE